MSDVEDMAFRVMGITRMSLELEEKFDGGRYEAALIVIDDLETELTRLKAQIKEYEND